MKVATTTIAADGTFNVDVPDFWSDPVVIQWGRPGRLNFVLRALRPYHGASERSTGAEIVGRPRFGPEAGIPLASSYESINLQVFWQ